MAKAYYVELRQGSSFLTPWNQKLRKNIRAAIDKSKVAYFENQGNRFQIFEMSDGDLKPGPRGGRRPVSPSGRRRRGKAVSQKPTVDVRRMKRLALAEVTVDLKKPTLQKLAKELQIPLDGTELKRDLLGLIKDRQLELRTEYDLNPEPITDDDVEEDVEEDEEDVEVEVDEDDDGDADEDVDEDDGDDNDGQ